MWLIFRMTREGTHILVAIIFIWIITHTTTVIDERTTEKRAAKTLSSGNIIRHGSLSAEFTITEYLTTGLLYGNKSYNVITASKILMQC